MVLRVHLARVGFLPQTARLGELLQCPLTASSLPGLHPSSASQPVGHDTPPPHTHTHRSHISDIHVMIHSSNKVIVMKQQGKSFYGWGGQSPHHEELYVESVRKVETLFTTSLEP